TYNKSTALTVYDAGGNSYLASVYYVKTQNASQETPNNKWQTYVYVGDKLVSASLQQATNTLGEEMYVNKYGELKAKSDFQTPEEIAELNSSFSKKTIKFSLDELTDIRTSQPATVTAGLATDLGTGSNDGVDFANYLNISKSDLLRQQGSSAVTFPVDSTTVGARDITFGPAAARVTVNIPANGTTAPTIAEVVSALNNNASFTSTYVAQAASPSGAISSVAFGAASSPTNPFASFNVNVGGQQFALTGLTSTLNASTLAGELQTKLRLADGGRTDISVTLASGTLTVTDAAKRNISGMALTKISTAATDVSTGSEPVYATPVLKITALDPNVKATEINDATSGVVVQQNSVTLTGTNQVTPYTRAKADYTLTGTPTVIKASFGPTAAPITIEGTSGTDLADNLNKNATFSADYVASFSGSALTLTAKDPSNATAAAISSSVKLYQNTAVAPT
ncbi:MAG: hypothetical protein JZU60_00595, partial [Ilumatobacteraceae bacterium]|nr:hypothetical protein [Ilumatobacteraceae bacterium]